MDINGQEIRPEKARKYDKVEAQLKLMCELIAGRKSGEENGWISADDVRNHFKERTNKIQYSSIACVTWTGFDRYVP